MVTGKRIGITKDKETPLQWHPAFFATLQIELAEESDKLIFESEHTLSTKPMLIDVLIIEKNIGRIFKNYNIIEYKSPCDYLSIDDFYKVYGYTCFYKSSSLIENNIPANELTITFVCKKYPYKFINHLKNFRRISTIQMDEGIYYLEGEYFPIQLIVTSKLSPENNLWLSSLTDDLKSYDIIDTISSEYLKHKRDKLYESAMNIIINANKEQFKEAKPMCEAIRELFKDEFDKFYEEFDKLQEEFDKIQEEYKNKIVIEKENARAEGIGLGIERGIEKGIFSTINSCKSLGATREQTLDLLLKNFSLTKDEAKMHIEKCW